MKLFTFPNRLSLSHFISIILVLFLRLSMTWSEARIKLIAYQLQTMINRFKSFKKCNRGVFTLEPVY